MTIIDTGKLFSTNTIRHSLLGQVVLSKLQRFFSCIARISTFKRLAEMAYVKEWFEKKKITKLEEIGELGVLSRWEWNQIANETMKEITVTVVKGASCLQYSSTNPPTTSRKLSIPSSTVQINPWMHFIVVSMQNPPA